MNTEVTFLPDNITVSVRPGTTVMDAARKAKVHIRQRCAGKAGCLMCKVTVDDPSGLAPMNQAERLKLGGSGASGVRLACQAKIAGSAVITVPEDPLKAAIRRQLEQQRSEAAGD